MKRSKRADSIYKNVCKSDEQQEAASEKVKANINDLLMSAMAHSEPKKESNCIKDVIIIQPKSCTFEEDGKVDDVDSPMTQKSISPPPYSPLTPLLLKKSLTKTSKCRDVDSPMIQKSISPPPYSPLTPLLLKKGLTKAKKYNIDSPTTPNLPLSPLNSLATPMMLQKGSPQITNFNHSYILTDEPMSSPLPPMTPETQQFIDDHCQEIEAENFVLNLADGVENGNFDTLEKEYIEDSDDSVKDPDYVEEANEVEDLDEDEYLDSEEDLDKNITLNIYKDLKESKRQKIKNEEKPSKYDNVSGKGNKKYLEENNNSIAMNNETADDIDLEKEKDKKRDQEKIEDVGLEEQKDKNSEKGKKRDQELLKDVNLEKEKLEDSEKGKKRDQENVEKVNLEKEKVEDSERSKKRDPEKVEDGDLEKEKDKNSEKGKKRDQELLKDVNLEKEKLEDSKKGKKRDQELLKDVNLEKEKLEDLEKGKKRDQENVEKVNLEKEKVEDSERSKKRDPEKVEDGDLEKEKVENSEKGETRDQRKAENLEVIRIKNLVDGTQNPTHSSADVLQIRPSTRSLKRRVSENDVMVQPCKRFCRSSSSDCNLFSLKTSKDTGKEVPKKKQVSDPAKWKRNVEKMKRLKGQSYETTKGKLIAAKLFKEPKCVSLPKHKCNEKVPEELRRKIFKEFHALESVDQQRHFIIQHVTKSVKKRETKPGPSRKQYTHDYTFTVSENKKEKVCRDFFLETLNISEGIVRGALKKLSAEGILLRDERGRKVPANRSLVSQKFMEEHILSYPAMESHYCRKNSQYRYLDSKLTIKTMYEEYKEKCEKEGIASACIESYRKIFRSYKLNFHKPKKDLCKKCVANADTGDDTHKEHLNRKEKAFQRRDDDKAAAQTDSKILAFNFDLESVLSTPKGAAGPFFYVRKLAVYNLTFYSLGNQDVDCYLWDETEGKRGSTEIATCVYQYINSKPDITHVRMMSDNCGGQQKNVGFCCMLMYLLANQPTIETIDHVYFETGHSHMECDSIHSKIEQKSKNTPVYIPDGWAQIIRMARKNPSPFKVNTLLHDDFLNFNAAQFQLAADLQKKTKQKPNKKLTKTKKDTKSEEQEGNKEVEEAKLNFKKAVWMQYRKQNPNSVFLKGSYENEDKFIEFKLRAKRGTNTTDIVPKKVYPNRLKISNAKKKDLLKLCDDKQIPRVYHQYYKSLPSSDTIVERLPEPDTDEEYEEED